ATIRVLVSATCSARLRISYFRALVISLNIKFTRFDRRSAPDYARPRRLDERSVHWKRRPEDERNHRIRPRARGARGAPERPAGRARPLAPERGRVLVRARGDDRGRDRGRR